MISDILTALYQPFGFSLILSVFVMFYLMRIKTEGWKKPFLDWWNNFKSDSDFRKLFCLIFYTTMILFRTLLNRDMWANPVANIIGVWGIYVENDGRKVLTTEVLENLILFIPFTFLLFWRFRVNLLGEKVKLGRVIWQSTKITFIFSFTIEMLQLFLRLGTWQLSDLFFNTVGGLFGGIIYYIGYKIKYRTNNK